MDRMPWNVRGVHQDFLSIKMRDFHGNYLRHNLGGRYLDIKMGNLPLVDLAIFSGHTAGNTR